MIIIENNLKYNVPIISLIGKSGVGKTTLFNRLVTSSYFSKFNDGICNSTVDKIYGYCNFKNYRFIIVDTAGDVPFYKYKSKNIFNNVDNISINYKYSINESNLFFIVIDWKLGLNNIDYNICKYLYNLNKNIVLIFNKIDSYKKINYLYSKNINFKLNCNKFYISSMYGYGLNKLLKNIIILLNNNNINYNDINKIIFNENYEIKNIIDTNYNTKNNFLFLNEKIISIVGKTNVGKSTLFNSILNFNRNIVDSLPNTTSNNIYVPFNYNGINYIIIDTIGINKNIFNKCYNNKLFLNFKNLIKKSNFIIYLIDISNIITNSDLYLLNYIYKNCICLIITFNKCDKVSLKKKKEIKEYIFNKFNLYSYKIFFISAFNRKNVILLLNYINNYYNYINNIKINTLLVNKIMKLAIYNYSYINKKNKIKIKYAHLMCKFPLTLRIYGNNVTKIKLSYKNYLINFYRKYLNKTGLIVKIIFININKKTCKL